MYTIDCQLVHMQRAVPTLLRSQNTTKIQDLEANTTPLGRPSTPGASSNTRIPLARSMCIAIVAQSVVGTHQTPALPKDTPDLDSQGKNWCCRDEPDVRHASSQGGGRSAWGGRSALESHRTTSRGESQTEHHQTTQQTWWKQPGSSNSSAISRAVGLLLPIYLAAGRLAYALDDEECSRIRRCYYSRTACRGWHESAAVRIECGSR